MSRKKRYLDKEILLKIRKFSGNPTRQKWKQCIYVSRDVHDQICTLYIRPHLDHGDIICHRMIHVSLDATKRLKQTQILQLWQSLELGEVQISEGCMMSQGGKTHMIGGGIEGCAIALIFGKAIIRLTYLLKLSNLYVYSSIFWISIMSLLHSYFSKPWDI